jgi:Ca-activated chloride channel family protein
MTDLHPYLRPAALLLPLLVALGLWLHARRRRRVEAAFRGTPFATEPRALGRLRAALAALAALALGAAVYDPGWRPGAEGASAAGGAVVLVLDVSSSMLAEDVPPDRLERARAAARRLARSLGDLPVGIVVFAGSAYALSPPTVDPTAIDLYLDALDPSMVTQTGSALGAAVRQGVGLLGSTRERTGTLVLISDGDAMEPPGEEEQALALARGLGVRVFTLGVGTPAGAPVPDVDLATGRRSGYKREPRGEVAVSRLGEELLRRIASRTGGEYSRLSSPRAVDALAARLRASPGGREADTSGLAGYEWLAAACLVLLSMEWLLPRLGTRRAA